MSSLRVGETTDTAQSIGVGWPAGGVPAGALVEWRELQAGLRALGRPPRCAEEPVLWFASAATPREREFQQHAAIECLACPLLVVCRAYAVAAREREGVWGGLTPADRGRARGGSGGRS